MREEVEAMLRRSPRPLPWALAMLAVAGTAILLHSLILAGLAGLLLGLYQGNYYGRIRVVRAWQRDTELEYEEVKAANAQLRGA